MARRNCSATPTVSAALSVLALLTTACTLPDRTLFEPAAAELGDATLHLLPVNDATSADDLAVATALGWQDGIPGVAIALLPVPAEGATEAQADTLHLVSDSDGLVGLAGLAVGRRYRVEAKRLLSAAEKAALGPASDAEAFVGIAEFTLAADSTVPLRLPVSFRRGLLLSEWSFIRAHAPSVDTYKLGGYFELYNNGTETVYLDGYAVGSGIFYSSKDWHGDQCATFAFVNNNPDRLYISLVVQFPGGGSSYPLEPGATVVVAMDAIDHRGLYPPTEQLNLSGADFEMAGGPDNPAVPDVLDRSSRDNPYHDHGPNIANAGPDEAALIAPGTLTTVDSVDVRTHAPGLTLIYPYWSVPQAAIHDLLVGRSVWSLPNPPPLCQPLLHPVFDRKPAELYSFDPVNGYRSSLTRRVLYLDPLTDRPVLQHTRSTEADWVLAPRTLGVIVP